MTDQSGAIDWTALEVAIGIEALPAFHRAFLASRGVPDPAAMPLRRVQQAVERELNRLVTEGRAARTSEGIAVDADVVAGLPAREGLSVGELLRAESEAATQ